MKSGSPVGPARGLVCKGLLVVVQLELIFVIVIFDDRGRLCLLLFGGLDSLLGLLGSNLLVALLQRVELLLLILVQLPSVESLDDGLDLRILRSAPVIPSAVPGNNLPVDSALTIPGHATNQVAQSAGVNLLARGLDQVLHQIADSEGDLLLSPGLLLGLRLGSDLFDLVLFELLEILVLVVLNFVLFDLVIYFELFDLSFDLLGWSLLGWPAFRSSRHDISFTSNRSLSSFTKILGHAPYWAVYY